MISDAIVFRVYSIPVEGKLIRLERMADKLRSRWNEAVAGPKQQSFFWIKTYCIIMIVGETIPSDSGKGLAGEWMKSFKCDFMKAGVDFAVSVTPLISEWFI